MNDAYHLLAKPAAAKLLGISTRTLDRIRCRGEIAWEQIGGQVRFDPSEIERYRESRRRGAQQAPPASAASIKELFPIAELDASSALEVPEAA